MNMEDFQEKMDPTHRMYLCRMINAKDLPEDLLKWYAQVKRLVDRIDGHLTPGDLAMMIMMADFVKTTEWEDAELQAEADKLAAKPSVGQTLDESDDKVIEEAVEPPVEPPALEQPVSEATGQAAKLWSPGMPVRAMHEDEIKRGKIVAVSRPSDVGQQVGATVKLTIEFEGGETATLEEKEVEAD